MNVPKCENPHGHNYRVRVNGAQGHLMRCDDGDYYVVKFQNKSQHLRILANEMLGTRLAARMGLPVPRAEVVEVRREFRQGPGNAFPGLGQRRWEEGRVAQLERKIGQQALEIDFLKGCLQRIEEQRQLQAVTGKPLSTGRSKAKGTESRL
jgi:hypothetical protein